MGDVGTFVTFSDNVSNIINGRLWILGNGLFGLGSDLDNILILQMFVARYNSAHANSSYNWLFGIT